MKLALIVGVGSFIGGISRYLLSTFIQERAAPGFPYGTFTVNLVGCFIIGCLFGLSERWQLGLEWRLLLFTGFLGGFTTFSAFSVESLSLFRSGQVGTAVVYVVGSVVIGIGLTFLGAWVFKFTPPQV